ncbi:unnamed protein product [Kuraishia capsulata CBS 1993]|uniref:Uncharacterized protein n=1 Tax=Kuraishia capsulata CBS 1993 TaxID=1382522 RepID=W6MN76_9ASCO|nr:uncharacterized protein KUCA_T00004022001 [Kuraishia capsulata CBS 1993]CDK28041.1 unnamed protein product [Kuraishia capsulata CBS 1993]
MRIGVVLGTVLYCRLPRRIIRIETGHLGLTLLGTMVYELPGRRSTREKSVQVNFTIKLHSNG